MKQSEYFYDTRNSNKTFICSQVRLKFGADKELLEWYCV